MTAALTRIVTASVTVRWKQKRLTKTFEAVSANVRVM